MKHLFIINPAAGSYNRTDEYSEIIHKICRARKLDYTILVSTAPGKPSAFPGRLPNLQPRRARNSAFTPAAVTAPSTR